MHEESFISREEQKTRYEQHHNSLDDAGYRIFLERFIQPVLTEILIKSESERKAEYAIQTVLDYGSGPEPALCELMKKLANEGKLLSKECEVRGWDPFFAPETRFFEKGADLVTCLEVAEHFETPHADMQKLADTVKSGGYVAIGTMLLPENCVSGNIESKTDAFKNWWYRSDTTHVAFYTLEGLIKCCAAAGLEFVKAVTDRAFLFRKRV